METGCIIVVVVVVVVLLLLLLLLLMIIVIMIMSSYVNLAAQEKTAPATAPVDVAPSCKLLLLLLVLL